MKAVFEINFKNLIEDVLKFIRKLHATDCPKKKENYKNY